MSANSFSFAVLQNGVVSMVETVLAFSHEAMRCANWLEQRIHILREKARPSLVAAQQWGWSLPPMTLARPVVICLGRRLLRRSLPLALISISFSTSSVFFVLVVACDAGNDAKDGAEVLCTEAHYAVCTTSRCHYSAATAHCVDACSGGTVLSAVASREYYTLSKAEAPIALSASEIAGLRTCSESVLQSPTNFSDFKNSDFLDISYFKCAPSGFPKG